MSPVVKLNLLLAVREICFRISMLREYGRDFDVRTPSNALITTRAAVNRWTGVWSKASWAYTSTTWSVIPLQNHTAWAASVSVLTERIWRDLILEIEISTFDHLK